LRGRAGERLRILLVVYDNDSYIHWFPQGLAYIAAVLKTGGHEVEVYNQDLHHYPEEHLTGLLDGGGYDVVGFSFIAGYYQYKKALEISRAVNRSRNRPLYIIGGHGPSPEPEFFLRKTEADIIVIGEGEETIVEVLERVGSRRPLDDVRGIAFWKEGKPAVNERRPLIKDIDSIPHPAYEAFPIEYYRLLRMPHARNSDFIMPVLSGRGCTFRCSFCYRMDKGFRPRSKEAIVEEIRYLKSRYGITYIAFSDELLMSSEKRIVDLCGEFLKARLGVKWDCNGRLNYAKPDVLKLMREAGCVFINYGIEAMDDLVLKKMNKALTTKQIVRGIEATLAAGISPGYNIIFGNIGDGKETLAAGVEFLLKYDDGAQMRTIRPVTPYPGSPLYDFAIEKGMLRDCEDFYENKHLNSDLLAVNFTELSDDEFHRCLLEANTRLIRNYHDRKCRDIQAQAEKLYLARDAGFRGFRQT
jgi:radical SAM superfamily enzyme YgiQ (UPF0313 family)